MHYGRDDRGCIAGMAVDGTTSPVHQHAEARRVKNDLDLGSHSSDEAVMPNDEANVDVKPSVPTSRHDNHQQLQNGRLTTMTSPLTIPSAESGSYYFGESHVTRLESFVESLTGPSSHPPVQRSRWSSMSPIECSNGVVTTAVPGSSSRKSAATSSEFVEQLAVSANQPLDLSTKTSGGHSRQKFNESPLSVGSSDGRYITQGDLLSAGLQAACYPSIADMWLAHWLNMATAASSLLTHLPLQLPVNQHLNASSLTAFGDHTTNGSHRNNHGSSDRRKVSPLVKSSMMESPKSTSSSSSSSLSSTMPTNGRTSSHGCKRERDVTPSSVTKEDRQRRDRDVTSGPPSSRQPTSAFSMFRGDRTDVEPSNGGRRNVTAALSAIESFVENSFSRVGNKTGHTTKTLTSQEPLNAGRRMNDECVSSSGEEDAGSRDDVKRRRFHQQMITTNRPEVAHLRRDFVFERPDGSRGSSETANSSLEYLRCLSYDRPIDSEHPLECLEKLVHVQSAPSRRQHAVGPSRASPSRHHRTGHDTEASPRRERIEINNHATYSSSSLNDAIETTLKSDDVASAELAGAFCRPTTSMVC